MQEVASESDSDDDQIELSSSLMGTGSTLNTGGGGKGSNIAYQPISVASSTSRFAPLSLDPFELFMGELRISAELVFSQKITWLLVFGPLAVMGDYLGVLSESICFVFAGLALIPCAERLSFVTEQVAEHTNGTIGALLNATFGNAPEFLISTAAMRNGFYRVVQLTLLGSILTNLLFVFGLSCLIGGLKWQVQELRITSGNASIGMLIMATAGLVLPAALKMSHELVLFNNERNDDLPTESELHFSRFNAVIMSAMYVSYLIFQLGTHKDEFDDSAHPENPSLDILRGHNIVLTRSFNSRVTKRRKSRKNKFCRRFYPLQVNSSSESDVEIARSSWEKGEQHQNGYDDGSGSSGNCHKSLPPRIPQSLTVSKKRGSHNRRRKFRRDYERKRSSSFSNAGDVSSAEELSDLNAGDSVQKKILEKKQSGLRKAHDSDLNLMTSDDDEGGESTALMSFRCGLLWLFAVTVCVSAMSDILVDTIDGFAQSYGISEVFTSIVIIPYFSNIAEQVSAVIFAYKNEMDLCIGITVGSSIQVALFVMPGCVLIGWVVDRAMSMYLKGFETCCLVLAVLCVAAVLQGGTTNWLVGTFFMGVYFMIAAGFWYHELEDLSRDAETLVHSNSTNDGG